jgi:drug/metabolite transporter (DMT)-like permease
LLSVVLTYLTLKLVTPNKQIVAFIIGSIGATWVLLSFTNESLSLSQWRLGDGIFLVACGCLALHVILVKRWATTVTPAVGAFYIMFLGSFLLLPFLVFFGDLSSVAWHQTKFWQALIYLTVFTTMATFFLQQHLLKKVGGNRLLAFTYLIPTLVVIPQGITNTSQLYGSLPGIILTLLALYLISHSANDTSHLIKELKTK